MTQPTGGRARPTAGSLTGPLTRYRVLAYATGVFLLLLTLHMIIQFAQWRSDDIPFSQTEGVGKWIPGGDVWIPVTHGWLYLAYVIASVDLWLRTRLSVNRMVLVVLAGTVPGMSFIAERWVTGKLRPMIAAVQPVPSERANR